MNTKLIFIGKLDNVLEVEFEGKKSIVLQFINRTKNGKLKIIDVKVEEDLEKIKKLEVGKEVKMEVSISTFNNNIYYKFIDIVK